MYHKYQDSRIIRLYYIEHFFNKQVQRVGRYTVVTRDFTFQGPPRQPCTA